VAGVANHRAIVSVGESLVTYLRNAYPAELSVEIPCDFRLVSSNELNASDADFGTAITLYLHRVTIDSNLRNSAAPAGAASRVPVSLNLHYLLTVWADSAANEQTVLGWAVRELYQHEALSQSDLTPAGGWNPEDVVQVIPGELSNEDMMRIWDALDPPYHLSLSYVARVVRIDPAARPDALPVVARRLELIDEVRR
jgi:Pvc16 N-terminal domain